LADAQFGAGETQLFQVVVEHADGPFDLPRVAHQFDGKIESIVGNPHGDTRRGIGFDQANHVDHGFCSWMARRAAGASSLGREIPHQNGAVQLVVCPAGVYRYGTRQEFRCVSLLAESLGGFRYGFIS
jgi:hypothetical protein